MFTRIETDHGLYYEWTIDNETYKGKFVYDLFYSPITYKFTDEELLKVINGETIEFIEPSNNCVYTLYIGNKLNYNNEYSMYCFKKRT